MFYSKVFQLQQEQQRQFQQQNRLLQRSLVTKILQMFSQVQITTILTLLKINVAMAFLKALKVIHVLVILKK